MEQRETVYKLYKDASKTIKNTMYLRPLCMGIGTGMGTFVSYVINSDNKVLLGVCAGVTGALVIKGLCNFSKFKREEKKLKLTKERLQVFQDEAVKILGEDVNLDVDNVLLQDYFCAAPGVSEIYNTIFKNGISIFEVTGLKEHECMCYNFFDEDKKQEGIDLSDAVYKAYHIIP